jgi:hypothetical protein
MRRNYYLGWLVDIVWRLGKEAREIESMDLILLEELDRIEFVPLIPNDDNRAADGIELRNTYLDHNRGGILPDIDGKPCSVLEMLIGLSYRLEFETAQSKWEKSPRTWFWILIDNLGIDYKHNRGLTTGDYIDKIRESVTLFVERRYLSSGIGGLFPLKRAKKDQKRVEIWYQMSEYMIENYPI